MNYESMSDFDINEAVKSALVKAHAIETELDRVFLQSLKGSSFDYCGNVNYAWPIILESKIAIEPIVCFGDLWQANIKHHKEVCANPLRAAMIVFLMMNEK